MRDIVDEIERLDLRDVVLVGHSYSGVPVGQAAERVGDRLARVVFVDANVPVDGTSFLDGFPSDHIRKTLDENGGAWPPLDPADYAGQGLTDEQITRIVTDGTAHPGASLTEPAVLAHPLADLPATYVKCLLDGDELMPRWTNSSGAGAGSWSGWTRATGRCSRSLVNWPACWGVGRQILLSPRPPVMLTRAPAQMPSRSCMLGDESPAPLLKDSACPPRRTPWPSSHPTWAAAPPNFYLATLLPDGVDVTVVETVGEDPGALRAAHVIITALSPVTAEHLAGAPELELVQCASHGYDYVDLDAARAQGWSSAPSVPAAPRHRTWPSRPSR